MTSSEGSRRSPWRTGVILLATFAAAVSAVIVALHHLAPGAPLVQRCVATVGEDRYTLDPDQADNAALFATIAAQRGLPERAVTIAIATGMQESKLRNIDYGDRDSLGLFQQRPSQGWGSEAEVMDPVYATHAFYAGLEQVPEWEQMEVTVAAQAVQRSGFPDAYAQHEAMARSFAAALTGQTEASLSCTLAPAFAEEEDDDEDGHVNEGRRLAMVTETLGARLERELPGVPMTVPDAVASGAQSGGAARVGAGGAAEPGYVTLRPGDEAGSVEDAERAAWALAHWAVATAQATNVSEVLVGEHHWSRDSQEWATPGDESATPPVGQVLVR